MTHTTVGRNRCHRSRTSSASVSLVISSRAANGSSISQTPAPMARVRARLDPLLHPSGKRRRVGAGEVAEPDHAEQRARVGTGSIRSRVDLLGERHVLQGGAPGEQRSPLGHPADLLAPRKPSGVTPSTSTEPDVGATRPAIVLSKVDLPHPLSPTTATNEPGSMSRSTSRSAASVPKSTPTPRSSIRAAVTCRALGARACVSGTTRKAVHPSVSLSPGCLSAPLPR